MSVKETRGVCVCACSHRRESRRVFQIKQISLLFSLFFGSPLFPFYFKVKKTLLGSLLGCLSTNTIRILWKERKEKKIYLRWGAPFASLFFPTDNFPFGTLRVYWELRHTFFSGSQSSATFFFNLLLLYFLFYLIFISGAKKSDRTAIKYTRARLHSLSYSLL